MLDLVSQNIILYSHANGHGYYLYLNIILVLGVIAILFYFFPKFKSKQSAFDFTDVFFKLIALSPQGVSNKQAEVFNKTFKKEFGQDIALDYKKSTEENLTKQISLSKIMQQVNKLEDEEIKVFLIYLLTKILLFNEVSISENKNYLKDLSKGIGLSDKQFNAILTMHLNENLDDKVNESLIILELDENAAQNEIQKKYRMLMILYHQDKFSRLGKTCVKRANDLSLKVANAYSTLNKD